MQERQGECRHGGEDQCGRGDRRQRADPPERPPHRVDDGRAEHGYEGRHGPGSTLPVQQAVHAQQEDERHDARVNPERERQIVVAGGHEGELQHAQEDGRVKPPQAAAEDGVVHVEVRAVVL